MNNSKGIVAGIVDSKSCEVNIEVVSDDVETLIPAPGRKQFPFMAELQNIIKQKASEDKEVTFLAET